MLFITLRMSERDTGHQLFYVSYVYYTASRSGHLGQFPHLIKTNQFIVLTGTRPT